MEAESTATGQYRLHHRGEILEKLALIQMKRSILRVTKQESAEELSLTLVRVDAEHNLLHFSSGTAPRADMQHVTISTHVDGILCRFALEYLQEEDSDGRRALTASLPDSLVWMQQRSYFRVVVPITMPVFCRILLPEGPIELPVIDIGMGGLALRDGAMSLGDTPDLGRRLEECFLMLPEQQELSLGLEIRNTHLLEGGKRAAAHKVGCAFFGMSRSTAYAVQRFVFFIELLEKRETPW